MKGIVAGCLAASLGVSASAADCNGNGVEDAIDVAPTGPGYRLIRKLELPAPVFDLALADMNADGKVDLTGISMVRGEVLVALGRGDWRWAEPSAQAMRSGHDLFLVEDLDRDGYPDVVTAGPEGLSFLFNQGNGDLAPVRSEDVSIGSVLSGIESADVDGDGWIDLVTVNQLGNISVLQNAGARHFEGPRNYASMVTLVSRPETVVAGDLDGDGHVDLALGTKDHLDRIFISVLWNDGQGGYPEISSSERFWQGVTLLGHEDIDEDGDGDLLLSTHGLLVAFRNEGGRVLSEVIFPWESSVSTPLLLDDLDSDGRAELTFFSGPCDGFVVVSRQGGSFAESMTFPAHRILYGLLRAGDLDGDGDRDLAVFERNSAAIHVFTREAALAGGDCNANGVPDACEDDCNANGIPDACDIASGEAEDCDGNGVPDECDPDCDTNLIPDACDIRDGNAGDCDGNGSPDTCDFPDANGNGVPDGCELASGQALDCNGNRILDEMETVPHLYSHRAMVSSDASYLSAADLDGDGFADLLVTAPGSGTDLLIWNGVGGPPLSSRGVGVGATRNVQSGVAALDLDADGDLDLGHLALDAACYPRTGLVLMENLGENRFRSGAWHSFPDPLPDSILAGDFDGDASPDIIAWRSFELWLLGGRPGGLTEPREIRLDGVLTIRHMAPVDLDSDGDLDLVTDTGFILTNPGDGSFFAEGSFPAGGSFVDVMDFGGDGLRDILTGGILAENRGGRVFVEKRLAGHGWDAAVGDFDGDGLEDAVFSSDVGIGLYLQRGDGFLVTNHRLPASTRIEAVDVNRDGRLDLAVLYTDGIAVHLNLTNPPFGRLGNLIGGGVVASLESVDLDRDGDLDLAGVSRDMGRLNLGLWLNDGAGAFIPEAPLHLGEGLFSPFVHGLVARDMDGDGDTDFAVATESEFILLERGAGGELSRRPVPALLGVPNHVIALDVDRDGGQDLVVQGRESEVSVLFNSGWPSFEAVAVVRTAGDGRGISHGDLDGDGDPDLIATSAAGILPIVYQGERRFSAGPLLDLGGALESSVPADFDGDGDVDLAAVHCTRMPECEDGPLLTLLRNDGGGSFGEPASRRASHLSQELEAADLDGDRDMDLVVSQGIHSRMEDLSSGESVEILLNRGQGEFQSWGLVRIGATPGRVAVADLDGDGALDLALGSARGLALLPFHVFPPSESDADGDGILDSCTPAPFRRGDWNADGRVDLSDAVALLGRLFLGGEATGCDDSGDADDDGKLDLTDALRILRHLFQGEAPPPAPHEDCGQDPTGDGLACLAHRGC